MFNDLYNEIQTDIQPDIKHKRKIDNNNLFYLINSNKKQKQNQKQKQPELQLQSQPELQLQSQPQPEPELQLQSQPEPELQKQTQPELQLHSSSTISNISNIPIQKPQQINYNKFHKVNVLIYNNNYNNYYNYNYIRKNYNVIYIEYPFLIYIIINIDGSYKFYKSDIQRRYTQEGLFDKILIPTTDFIKIKIDLQEITTIISKVTSTPYYKNGYSIIDTLMFSSKLSNLNNSLEYIKYLYRYIYDMKSYLPTYEQLYGFSNIYLGTTTLNNLLKKYGLLT